MSLYTQRIQSQPTGRKELCTASRVQSAPAPTSVKQAGPWTIASREHRRALKNGDLAASTLAEHVFSCKHRVHLSKATVIDTHSHTDSLHARVLAYPAPTGRPTQQRQGHPAWTLRCTLGLTLPPSGLLLLLLLLDIAYFIHSSIIRHHYYYFARFPHFLYSCTSRDHITV